MLEALGLMQQEVNTANAPRSRSSASAPRRDSTVMQLNFFDKVAMQVAPRWATNRIRARIMVDTLARHYEAAQPGFRTAGWRRSAADPNVAIGPALHTLAQPCARSCSEQRLGAPRQTGHRQQHRRLGHRRESRSIAAPARRTRRGSCGSRGRAQPSATSPAT
jgi:hypothetical protein